MSAFIVNGTLIDGTGTAPTPLRWIEIEGERIVGIVRGEGNLSRPLPDGGRVLFDAAGLTVLPGIVDAHCLICPRGSERTHELAAVPGLIPFKTGTYSFWVCAQTMPIAHIGTRLCRNTTKNAEDSGTRKNNRKLIFIHS